MERRTDRRRPAKALAVALTAAAMGAPAALADPPQGHRAPAGPPTVRIVPDALDRGPAVTSPRKFERADGYQPQLRVATPAVLPSPGSDGFAWGDAGIGALLGFAAALFMGGSMVLLRGRGRVAHS
jgi:hypothetical protein